MTRHVLIALSAVVVLVGFLGLAQARAAQGDIEWGLAAQYPGDTGIEKDPAVVYFTGYEDESWKDRWGCSDWDSYSLTDDSGLVFAGRKSLQKFGPMGKTGASLTYDLPRPVDVLYHRVYARFSREAANTRFIGISGVAEGMPQWKAMGSAGVRPTELPYFCATLTTLNDQPRRPIWYPYHIDQKGPWGDNWPIDVEFPADKWFCLEMMVKMNTAGERDGELHLWVDGKHVYGKTDIRWRLDPTVQVGRAFDQVYRSKPFPRGSYYWVDNRVVATEYIGPMLPAGSTPMEVTRKPAAKVAQADTGMVEKFRADFETGSVGEWGNAELVRPGYQGSKGAVKTVVGSQALGLWGLDVPVTESTLIGFAYRTEAMPSLQLMLWGKGARDNFRFSLPATGGRWKELALAGNDFTTLDGTSLLGDTIGGVTFITDNREIEGQKLWVDNFVIGERAGRDAEGPSAKTPGAPPQAEKKPAPGRTAAGSVLMPEHRPTGGGIHLFVDPGRRSAEDREQHSQYGLSITAPWNDGGTLFINFPEHLEYDVQGRSILRHWDNWEDQSVPWVLSPDGKQASYRVESPHPEARGVVVEAFARVADPEEVPEGTRGVHLAMRVINNGESALPTVRPLLCFQYRELTGFPAWIDNFKHSFLVFDGKLKRISQLPTENPDTKFKGCVVKGCPQRDTRAERQGGLIAEDMDLALSVVESMDGKRKLIVWWTPGKSMITNANIPCIHADPYFGSLEPGQSAYAEGLALFTEKDDLTPIIKELKSRDRTAF